MPVHDWTRASDGTFHDFHFSCVLEIKRALKRGILPKGYYVMAEQIGGDLGTPDALTLQAAGAELPAEDSLAGTATLAESCPRAHLGHHRARFLRSHATHGGHSAGQRRSRRGDDRGSFGRQQAKPACHSVASRQGDRCAR
ncbi:MAG: hypothetical protein FJ303_17950 [Planctomycetes bacterium]|nr:hypothetical protein [Planctomycetota bacterium]